MKVTRLHMDNFMIFNHIDAIFSPNINIISGENSTGKTALIKLLYSCVRSLADTQNAKGEFTKERLEYTLVSKLQGVFRPDKDAVGRLVNRKPGSNRTEITLEFDDYTPLRIGFGNRQNNHLDIYSEINPAFDAPSAVYVPPKEIISATANFGSLYDQYHIAFEETYYDLARLLELPLKKGPNTDEQNTVIKNFSKVLSGHVFQKDNTFFLKVKGAGEFEMGLVSEGYRKLSTIMYLILSGSLSSNAILFWDEPETNMNPKMIKPMVDAIIELAKMGVQVFVTTHDYFVQQCFSMAAKYQKNMNTPLEYNFVSLYRNGSSIEMESSSDLFDLTHNAIMEEFDNLYDREQEFIYEN